MYLPTLEHLFDLGEDEKIMREMASTLPDDPLLDVLGTVLTHMRGSNAPMPLPDRCGEGDMNFLHQIWTLPKALGPNQAIRSDCIFPRIQIADNSYDFLATTWHLPWSIAKLLNFVAMRRVIPSRRSAVVTTMRNDGISILEFVAHYRALGFDHIFVFSNDSTDGTTELLRLLAEHEVITYIENPITPGTEPVIKAYEYSIQFLSELRAFEWVLFVDSDELLEPATKFGFKIGTIIDAIEAAYPEERPSAICWVWKWYGGHTFRRRTGLQLQTYKYARINPTVKSMVRLAEVKTMRGLHYPECRRGSFFLNSALERIGSAEISKTPANWTGGWINHYWNKSFEEYAVKKLRSDVQTTVRNEEQYFSWNVPASDQNFDPPSNEVVTAVLVEYQNLLMLPDVRELNTRISDEFPKFLSSLVDVDLLRARFDERSKKYPEHKYEV